MSTHTTRYTLTPRARQWLRVKDARRAALRVLDLTAQIVSVHGPAVGAAVRRMITDVRTGRLDLVISPGCCVADSMSTDEIMP